MSSYLELNDEGAAISAANRLTAIGQRLDDWSTPPAVEWGDDEFGEAMRGAYYLSTDGEPSIPTQALAAKHTIGGRLGEVGEAVNGAVTEVTLQEQVNFGELDGVQAPDV